ncbi:hypothetical conserved protein [Oceanobacillus iheyensis HTE831]|uniref:Hypothetical conserved protein n=1 Tax=Oceanobacillus iheyensis (strain DSM 14371 / CIP 107618 / JCM 11309 / KCTC 3954 / HTE831) TaxID=221109 RepID=Q8ERG7_OCEIH|nr:DUF443 family protein [Oceanobacillus iheyensis]BAC13291.1 hypothetical conserved protein [Oceanobacillus iheyensis HTE831]
MKCNVQGVFKNLRYRIVEIDEEKYILDMGNSIWKIIFPFLHWVLPKPVYKIDNQVIVEKLKVPDGSQPKTISTGTGALGGLIGVVLASLIRPLANMFHIPSTPLINFIITIVVVIIALSVFVYINTRSKRKLTAIVDYNHYPRKKLWIRLPSLKFFFNISFSYLFFMAFTVVPFMGFIETGNIIVFIGSIFCL